MISFVLYIFLSGEKTNTAKQCSTKHQSDWMQAKQNIKPVEILKNKI